MRNCLKTKRFRYTQQCLLTVLFLFMAIVAKAQAGKKVYQFVELPASARVGALGGVPQAIADNDLNLATINPSLLSVKTEQKATINYTNYVAGISLANVAYSFHTKYAPGTLAAGLVYLNSGKTTRYDEWGNSSGSFSSNEVAFCLSYCQHFDTCFAIGASLKPVFSHIGDYTSIGLLADVATTYKFRNNRTTTSVLLRNFGSQITAYDDNYADTPFEILAAISHTLEHAPFRISLVLQQMQKFKLKPGNKNTTDLGSEVDDNDNKLPNFIDNCLRHCVLGIELFPEKTFTLRGGFNYKRRQELKLSNSPGMAGLSFGFGLKLKRFSVEYANARYTLGGRSNHFSIVMNLVK